MLSRHCFLSHVTFSLHIASIELGRIDALVRADYLHSRILTRRGPGSALNSTARLLFSVIFTRPEQVPNW